ncbi:TetR/AcrR family transcriptional regulator [Cohnella sp. CFH 77786]|uniref:TetR/AcrR family transcriptional regulator n=1 Tax=Cohnella sp. CFH 77786 TaxID=2662265 RepID=UPI001C60AC3E|nr:TetR/AcrR family transcriptional regulator [Cohnella sp. CFH 77786]
MSVRAERKDAAEHRKLILRTAESLFDLHGVRGVSMHQIARTAGIGQGTLYRKYAHKGDLCLDIIQDYTQAFVEEVGRYLAKNREKPAEDRLGWVLDMWIDAMEKKSELIMTIQAHHCAESEESRAASFFQSSLYLFMRGRISELLAEIAESRPGPNADPVLTAHALICAMAPVGHFHIKRELGYTKEQMKNHYRRMCYLPVSNANV